MGRKPLSLQGQKFGRLAVLRRVESKVKKDSKWLCRCDCGVEKIISGISLKSGRTLSCGCLNDQNRRERPTSLIGKKFGKLTVIEKTDRRKRRKIVWKCLCECGNICEAATDNLIGGDTQSCGCAKLEANRVDCVEETRLRNLTKKKNKTRPGKDSGVKGVTWDASRQLWRPQIEFKGKAIYLGRYANLEDAIKARKKAEEIYFEPVLDKYKKPGGDQP